MTEFQYPFSKRIIDTLPLSFMVVDEDLRVVIMNLHAEKLLGITGDESTGKKFFATGVRILSKNNRAIAEKDYPVNVVLREDREIKGYEHILIRPEGVRKLISLNAAPFHSRDGKSYVFLSISDITHHQEIEDSLDAARNKLSATLEAIPDILIEIDEKGMLYSYHSPDSVSSMLSAEAIGKRISDVFPKGAADILISGLECYILSNFKEPVIYRLDLPDGSKWYEARFSKKKSLFGEKRFIVVSRDITRNKQDEESIRELARFPAQSPYPIIRVDKAGTILYSNEPGDSFIKRKIKETGKPLPPQWPALVKRLIKSGDLMNNIEERNNGRTFSFTAVPVKEHEYVNFYGMDITDRKSTEKALKKSKDLLMNVVNNAPVVLFSIDKDGVFVLSEGRGLKSLRLSPGEVVGKSVFEVYKDFPEITSAIKSVLNGEELTKLIKIDDLIFETTYSPLYGDEGEIVGATGVAVDITQTAKSELALRESNEMLAEAQHLAHLGNWSWDLASNKIINSLEGRRLFNIPEHATSVDLNDYLEKIDEEDRRKVSEALFDAAKKSRPYETDYKISLPDGRKRIIHDQGEIVKDSEGKPLKMIGIVQDITERQLAEESLRQKDRDIKKAYADVFSAVTGDKLLIMTEKEIEESLGRRVGDTMVLTRLKDLSRARNILRKVLMDEFSLDDPYELIVSAGEIMTNAIKHAAGCRVDIYKKNNILQIKVTDKGPGIDFSILPKATLVSGFSTSQSLGLGFSIILEICDRVLLTTQPGHTSVVLEIFLTGPSIKRLTKAS